MIKIISTKSIISCNKFGYNPFMSKRCIGGFENIFFRHQDLLEYKSRRQTEAHNTVESRYNVPSRGFGIKYVVIVRCIRTENFPQREIETWEKVRYNGGYVVTRLYCICHY